MTSPLPLFYVFSSYIIESARRKTSEGSLSNELTAHRIDRLLDIAKLLIYLLCAFAAFKAKYLERIIVRNIAYAENARRNEQCCRHKEAENDSEVHLPPDRSLILSPVVFIVIAARHFYSDIAPFTSDFSVFEVGLYLVNNTAAEEYRHIYKGYRDTKTRLPVADSKHRYEIIEQKCRINPREPFRLYGNKEEQQELFIREKHRKRKEQRHIEIFRRCIARDEAADYRSDNAREVENVEPKAAPYLLELRPDEPVEITAYKHKYRIGTERTQNERKNSPNLPLHHSRAVEIHIAAKIQFGEKIIEDKHYHAAYDNIKHKVGDIIFAEFAFHFI